MTEDTHHLKPEDWQQIKSWFIELTGIPASQAYEQVPTLTRDPMLQQALRDMLDVHHTNAPRTITPGQSAARAFLQSQQLKAGDSLAEFEVIKLIGEGGMGQVYLCKPLDQQLKNEVAIKMLWKQSHDDSFNQHFKREQAILSQLKHRHIAQFYTAGVNADEHPYVVMEYVQGQNIIEHCTARNLSTTQRIRLFLQLCEAIQYAHDHLIIHRDIKPNNILVASDGQIKLLDFGIAKIIDDQDVQTMTVNHLMTTAYASPEQVAGLPLAIHTDIYSMGVVLYELLTGCRPFDHTRLSPAQYEKTLFRQTPVKPSTKVMQAALPDDDHKSLNRLSKSLKGDLDKIILKAINADPKMRYPSVSTLRQDLENHLHNRPVLAQTPGLWYITKKFILRNKQLFTLGTVFCLVVTALVINMVFQNREIKIQRQQAITQQLKAEQLSSAFKLSFKNADPTASGQAEVSAIDILKQAEQLILDQQPEDLTTHNELLLAIAETYANLGRHNETLHLLEQINTALIPGGSESETLYHALRLQVLKDLAMAERLKTALGDVPPDQRQHPRIQQATSLAYIELGQYMDAYTTIKSAYDNSQPGQPHRPETCLQYSQVLYNMSEATTGLKVSGDCLNDIQMRTSNNRSHTWLVSQLQSLHGRFLSKLGQHEQADEVIQQAIAAAAGLLGEDHLNVTNMYNSLALNDVARGDYEAALKHHTITHQGKIKHYGSGHPKTIMGYYRQAQVHRAAGNLEQAEQLYLEALSNPYTADFDFRINATFIHHGLAMTQQQLGKLDEAEKNHQISFDRIDGQGEGFISIQVTARLKLAEIYLQTNRPKLAKSMLKWVDDHQQHIVEEHQPLYQQLKTTLLPASAPDTAWEVGSEQGTGQAG